MTTVTDLFKGAHFESENEKKGRQVTARTTCGYCYEDIPKGDYYVLSVGGKAMCRICADKFPSKVKKGEAANTSDRFCSHCHTLFGENDTIAIAKDGSFICTSCYEKEKVPVDKQLKPWPKTHVCSYCGCEVTQVWIYSGNGLKRCKDCVVSGYKDDPEFG